MTTLIKMVGLPLFGLIGFLFATEPPNHPPTANPGKALVEKGRYLVMVGGCNDCHTPKKLGPKGPELDESRLLSGHPQDEKLPDVPAGALGPGKWGAITNMGLTAWAGPWGVSFTRNLTPDMATGLGSWTEAMFIKTLRTGKHMGEGRDLLPPMPWEPIGHMTNADLKAMWAYLHSLKPISNNVPDPIAPNGSRMPTSPGK